MELDTIISKNESLAIFLGFTKINNNNASNGYSWVNPHKGIQIAPNLNYDSLYSENLLFHKSWDWLMPCIRIISNKCEEPEELDGLKYALLSDDIITAWNFVTDYVEENYLKIDDDKILQAFINQLEKDFEEQEFESLNELLESLLRIPANRDILISFLSDDIADAWGLNNED